MTGDRRAGPGGALTDEVVTTGGICDGEEEEKSGQTIGNAADMKWGSVPGSSDW